ncbi:MAG TPA: ABC-2 family transporter protein [Polyangia bacterium]
MSVSPLGLPKPAAADDTFLRALRHAARAYPTMLRVGLSEVVAYRAEFIVWILTTNMPFVMLAIWHAVAAEGAVGRFGRADFVAYYLGGWVIRLLTSTWLVWELSMEIRGGTLSARLLRPLHPLFALSAQHLAALPMRALVVTPVVVAMFVLAGDKLAIRDPRILAIFLVSLVGAWLLIFFTMVLLGSLAFFVESAIGIFEMWLALHSILSGYLVPLELLPRWVARVARVSPFDSMLAFPLETLTGKRDLHAALTGLGVQWLYLAVMAFAGLAVWRRGVRRYVAFGG